MKFPGSWHFGDANGSDVFYSTLDTSWIQKFTENKFIYNFWKKKLSGFLMLHILSQYNEVSSQLEWA